MTRGPRVIAIIAASAIAATSAVSQERISLRWGECVDGGGSSNRALLCVDNISNSTLIPSFVLAAPVDSVIALEIVVDVQHALSQLPDWWHLEPTGCRAGNLSASAEYSSLGACTDPWSTLGVGSVQAWNVGEPRGGANQARMIVTSAVPSSAYATLSAGTPYYGALVVLHSGSTIGPTVCTGCSAGACLVLNSIRIIRLPGASPASVDVVTPGPGAENWVTWQGGGAASCSAVPIRNVTWGRLKGFYR